MESSLNMATGHARAAGEAYRDRLIPLQTASIALDREDRRSRRPSQISRAETATETLQSDTTSLAYSVPSPGSDFQLTPPPHLSGRGDSDFPPTPPTLADSDLLTTPPPPDLTSQNARTEAGNGLYLPKTTPVMLEARSPPTPDPSPPGPRRATLALRPNLSKSPSSWTESYQTAREELSTLDVTSEGLSRPESSATPVARAFPPVYPKIERSPRIGLRGSESNLDRISSISNTHVRTQMRHLELESGVARALKHMAAGRASASPRPQSANGYLTMGRSRMEFPRPPETPERVKSMSTPKPFQVHEPTAHLQGIPEPPEVSSRSEDRTASNHKPRIVTEDQMHAQTKPIEEAPALPLTPTAAAFLHDNNQVYRLIQQENVRRHSGASDVAMQMFAKSASITPRTLRHTTKRHSLRMHGEIPIDATNDDSVAPLVNRSHIPSREKSRARPQTSSSLPPQMAMNGFERFKAQNPDVLANRPHSAVPRQEGIPDVRIIPRASSTQHEGGRLPSERALYVSEIGNSHTLRTVSGPSRLTHSSHSHEPGLTVQSDAGHKTHQLRKFSNEHRLEKNSNLRQVAAAPPENHRLQQSRDQVLGPAHERHRRAETRSSHRVSLDRSMLSPVSTRRESLDRNLLSPVSRSSEARMMYSGTPNSVGQSSIRTEVELCEARGLQMFPHSNNSLLVVQQTARAVRQVPLLELPSREVPQLAALAIPQVSAVSETDNVAQQEEPFSPWHNPRDAPPPPIINYIPPTPLSELDRPLGKQPETSTKPATAPMRKLSLKQRVRRYSESLIQPLQLNRNNTLKRSSSKRASVHEERPTYLSSMWTPRGFWEEYDSCDDSDDEYDPEDECEPLPPGGDTSDVQESQKRSILPRNLSVRMPGFRGTGGFLIGNSLGISRHGTNVRRHHVARRPSQEAIKRSPHHKTFRLPFPPTAQLRKSGHNAWKGLTTSRATREQEKRRDDLRAKIGATIYNDK